MEAMLIELLVNYGDKALAWAVALFALAATWTMRRVGASKEILDVLRAVGVKARDVVMEVYQTYVEALKEGRADGRLTEDEKREAMRRAKTKLLERLTWREGALLAGGLLLRLFGKSSWAAKLDRLIEGQLETAIAESKYAAGPRLKIGEAIAPIEGDVRPPPPLR